MPYAQPGGGNPGPVVGSSVTSTRICRDEVACIYSSLMTSQNRPQFSWVLASRLVPKEILTSAHKLKYAFLGHFRDPPRDLLLGTGRSNIFWEPRIILWKFFPPLGAGIVAWISPDIRIVCIKLSQIFTGTHVLGYENKGNCSPIKDL